MAKYIVAGDKDLGDLYLCKRMRFTDGRYEDPRYNPVVMITHIIKYPIQHTIIWKDEPTDNAPLTGGLITRLAFHHDAAQEELDFFLPMTYEESLHIALSAAISSTYGEQFTILVRHMAGIIADRRTVVEFQHSETEEIP